MGCILSKNREGGTTNGKNFKSYHMWGFDNSLDKREEIGETKTIELGSLKVRYAYLSQRGFYPEEICKPNQDSYCITENFCDIDSDAFFAVFDGHGTDGEKCAKYARDRLPHLISKYVKRAKQRANVLNNAISENEIDLKNANTTGAGTANDLKQKYQSPETTELSKEQLYSACSTGHLQTNRGMHRCKEIDDVLSGTTAISCYIQGRRNKITVCNVGDSRAVLGQIQHTVNHELNNDTTDNNNTTTPHGPSPSSTYKAIPLSRDQTPYRTDERNRVLRQGARILSLDQMEGLELYDEAETMRTMEEKEVRLGEEIDADGDPPRVWSPDGEYPGTAFTRSIGDVIAEDLGVIAEPEILSISINKEDKIIVLASDGVFEFLTNQSVIDICAKFNDPLEACRAVVAESYELWLQYELRTDDITMICIFIDDCANDLNANSIPNNMLSDHPEISSDSHSTHTNISPDTDTDDSAQLLRDSSRPVRKHLTKEKTKIIAKMKDSLDLDAAEEALPRNFDITKMYTEKSEEENHRISEAIKASVMLKNLSDSQRDMLYKVLEPIDVEKGDWIIKQGTAGDRFYIVDYGNFEVRIRSNDNKGHGDEEDDDNGGKVVHVYKGSREQNAHPSFGELALMYRAPRAASIIAQTNGRLWALHRYAFRKVLTETKGRHVLFDILPKIKAFEKLDSEEIENIVDIMEEATFGRGEAIIRQGVSGSTFYVICNGSCELSLRAEFEVVDENNSLRSSMSTKQLRQHDYFGEEIFLNGANQYLNTVIATTNTTCWKLEKITIKQILEKVKTQRRLSASQIVIQEGNFNQILGDIELSDSDED